MAVTNQPRIDDERATSLLASGLTVRDVARLLDVSTQAIYKRITAGKISRPEKAA